MGSPAPNEASLDRRRFLRRSAAAGAVAWVAPAVVSSPAAAQSGTTPCEFDEVEVVALCDQLHVARVQWSVARACADTRVRVEVDGAEQEPCFQSTDSFDVEEPVFGSVTVTVRLLSDCDGDELDVREVTVFSCVG